MTLVGVLAGVIISSFANSELSNQILSRQDIIDQRNSIFQKRIEIIERASKVLNSKIIIESANKDFKLYSNLVKRCGENPNEFGGKPIDCFNFINTSEASKTLQVKNQVLVEFGIVMQLSSLYFGEKTRKYAKELASISQWWLADEKVYANYLSSMQAELQQY